MDLADGLGMFNAGIQYAGAQIGAVKDKKWISKENQKARDFQLEMWNKANEYNMPSAVMQRYVDAGLNPNLIYDNGAKAGMAELASSPGHSAPNMHSKDLVSYLNIVGTLLQKSQIDVNKSIEAKNYEEAYKARKEGDKVTTEGDIMSASKDELININKRTAYILGKQGIISGEQAALLENQRNFSDYYKETTFTFYDSHGNEQQVTGWQLDVMKSIEEFRKLGFTNEQIFRTIGKLSAETQDIYTDIEVKEESIKLMQSEQYKNYVEADYYKSAEYLNFALAAKYQQETVNLKEMLPYNQFKEYWLGQQSKHGVNLTDAQINKEYIDMMNAYYNGELDRYLKSVPQRYGSSLAGSVLSFVYEALIWVKNGSTYYQPNN